MPAFELTANPFWLLRTSIRARQQEVVEAFEEAASDGRVPESDLLRAQQAILTPKTRLEAELTWLPELSPARATKIVGLLAAAPPREVAVSLLDGIEGIARANLAADICNRYPGDAALVTKLARSYRTLELEQIKSAINANRAVSGFSKINDDAVRELLVKIETAHAQSASGCLAKSQSPGRALTSLIDGISLDVTLEYGFLDALVREYRVWVEPTLRRIGDALETEMAAFRKTPDDSAQIKRISKIDAGVRMWSEFSAPIEMWDSAKGLDEPRSNAMCEQLRDLTLFLANEKDLYEASLAITQTLLTNFANLKGMSEKLKEDSRILEGWVKRGMAAKLEEARSEELAQTTAALDWLKRSIDDASANMVALQSSLLMSGFSLRSTGISKQVHDAFSNALAISRGSEFAEIPWRMVRGLAIDLNNRNFEQAAERLASDLLNIGRAMASPSILTLLEGDLRTVRKNITWKQADYFLKTAQEVRALPLLQSLIANESPGDDLSKLNNFYLKVLADIEIKRRRNKDKAIKWVCGAIVVIVLIAIKSCSSDDPATRSSNQTPTIQSPTVASEPSTTDSSAMSVSPQQLEPTSTDQIRQPSGVPSEESLAIDDGTEIKPPAGTNLALSRGQLRYCEFQGNRITKAKELSSSNAEISNVNVAVDDFNLRCSQFRYRPSDMSAVKAEEAKKDVELEQGARNLLLGMEP